MSVIYIYIEIYYIKISLYIHTTESQSIYHSELQVPTDYILCPVNLKFV